MMMQEQKCPQYLINCHAQASSGWTPRGFKSCFDLVNCVADVSSTAVYTVMGFDYCNRMTHCIGNMVAPTSNGFNGCNYVSNSESIGSGAGQILAFAQSNYLSGCYGKVTGIVSGNVFAFASCSLLTNCVGEVIGTVGAVQMRQVL